MKKWFLSVFVIISLSVIGFFIFFGNSECKGKKNKKNNSLNKLMVQSDSLASDSLISICAVGDVMPGSNFPANSKLPDNCAVLFENVKQYFANSDIIFCNLEGVLLDSGGTPKYCSDSSKCYRFRIPEKYLANLIQVGFNTFSVANNHSGDFGETGRQNTLKLLNESSKSFAGFESKEYSINTIKGFKIGFTAFGTNEGIISIHNRDKCRAIIEKLNTESNIVILSLHIGGEGTRFSNLTGNEEIFLGENRGNPIEFARWAIDLGADVIICHGPHVPRAIELYNKKLIAYSLGNFCTNGSFNISGLNGIAPILKLKVDRNGDFISGMIIPTRQKTKGYPIYDEEMRAVRQIKKLSETDFPHNNIVIEDNGRISLK